MSYILDRLYTGQTRRKVKGHRQWWWYLAQAERWVHQWTLAAESDWWELVETHWMTHQPAHHHLYTVQYIIY